MWNISINLLRCYRWPAIGMLSTLLFHTNYHYDFYFIAPYAFIHVRVPTQICVIIRWSTKFSCNYGSHRHHFELVCVCLREYDAVLLSHGARRYTSNCQRYKPEKTYFSHCFSPTPILNRFEHRLGYVMNVARTNKTRPLQKKGNDIHRDSIPMLMSTIDITINVRHVKHQPIDRSCLSGRLHRYHTQTRVEPSVYLCTSYQCWPLILMFLLTSNYTSQAQIRGMIHCVPFDVECTLHLIQWWRG